LRAELADKNLHIISLEVPYPPLRGNVIGIYHRIKSLYEAGVSITLHAFYKNLNFPEDLANYCKSVYLYPRKPMWRVANLTFPLFVQSRRDPSLMDRLLADSDPIWFEGLHTLFHFEDPRLRERKKYIRMHNVESTYYRHLALSTPSLAKKMYFHWESGRSKWLEQKLLSRADGLFTISREETDLFNASGLKAQWLPPFHPHTGPLNLSGRGEYAIYHGDLSIQENEDAALFLINRVFDQMDFPLIIAGHRPSNQLISSIKATLNTTLITSPTYEKMNQLIQDAHIVLLPFTQTTGYKMKMIDSLAMGRHIITSRIMQVHTEWIGLVKFADEAAEWKNWVKQLKGATFTSSDTLARKELFDTLLNNQANAEKIVDFMYSPQT
jgi:hypothetical protein